MKKNIFLALGALALLAGVSAGVSARVLEKESEPVYAADTAYSLIGTFDGKSWNTDYVMQTSERAGYNAYRRVFLNRDDELKVRKDQNWSNSWGYSSVETGDLKSNYISESEKDGNIKVKIKGYYDIWFKAEGAKILMEYADTGASYIFAKKEFPKVYIFENNAGEFAPWSWGDAPNYYILPIQKANDMRINNSGGSYHDYHAFRVNQNLLDNYKIILKGDDMGQTCNLYADSPCVIMDTGQGGAHTTYPTTNGYYKLCKMMVDISGSMGKSKYQGRDYIYSICNTSQAESAAIATAYDGLLADSDATVRGITPKVVLYTYNNFNAENVEYSKAEISISKVIEVLRSKGTGAIVTPSTALNVSGMGAQNSAALIAGLAVLGLAAGGTMVFLAKRRKEI